MNTYDGFMVEQDFQDYRTNVVLLNTEYMLEASRTSYIAQLATGLTEKLLVLCSDDYVQIDATGDVFAYIALLSHLFRLDISYIPNLEVDSSYITKQIANLDFIMKVYFSTGMLYTEELNKVLSEIFSGLIDSNVNSQIHIAVVFKANLEKLQNKLQNKLQKLENSGQFY